MEIGKAFILMAINFSSDTHTLDKTTGQWIGIGMLTFFFLLSQFGGWYFLVIEPKIKSSWIKTEAIITNTQERSVNYGGYRLGLDFYLKDGTFVHYAYNVGKSVFRRVGQKLNIRYHPEDYKKDVYIEGDSIVFVYACFIASILSVFCMGFIIYAMYFKK